MEITSRELARLIELNKKKAELEFKKTVLDVGPNRNGSLSGSSGSGSTQNTETELKAVTLNAVELTAKIQAAGVEMVFPNEIQIQTLGTELAAFSPPELKEALATRSGPTYELFCRRGRLVKANYENRLEIAKLSMALKNIPSHDRDMIVPVIRAGRLIGELELGFTNEATVGAIAKFLRRCGMPCKATGRKLIPDTDAQETEIKFDLQNRSVWITPEDKVKLEENLSLLSQVNAKIQLKNAERQIKIFSKDEETDFELLQKQYLDLLKAQDDLLHSFNDEENICKAAAPPSQPQHA